MWRWENFHTGQRNQNLKWHRLSCQHDNLSNGSFERSYGRALRDVNGPEPLCCVGHQWVHATPHIGCGNFSAQRFFKPENSFWGGDFTTPCLAIFSCAICHLLEQSLRACCSVHFFVFAAARTHQFTRFFFLPVGDRHMSSDGINLA